MAFLNELGKKTQSVANAAAEMAKNAAGIATETARKTADTVKVNAAIMKEQHELDKNYRTIGEWFATEYQGEIPEAVADVMSAINASKEKIAQLQADKAQKEEEQVPEGMKVCPVCGQLSEGKFCPQCGAPLEE